MLPNGRRLGAHLPLGSGMVKAADRAGEIGASAIQIFSDNPTAWRRRPSLPDELPAFRERLAANDVWPIAIHAPYLVNLAGPEPAFFDQSVLVLVNELRVARAYGARFVNLHVGSHRGEGTAFGVARVAEGLARVIALADEQEAGEGSADDPAGGTPVLVLENGSGGGFGLGTNVEELGRLEQAITARGVSQDRYGYCLDAAHLWGAGHPINTAAGVDEVLASFDRTIGIHRLHMVHLNDSRSELGSRSDRHEHIGAGQIGAAGLGRLLVHPGLDHVVYYLETPGMEEGYDAVNLARAKALVAGEPLDALPPEAFRTRSAKGRTAPAEAGPDDTAGASHKPNRPRRAPRRAAR